MTNKRTRNWTFILYPESAPKDWQEILDSMHVAWVESPLHDMDRMKGGGLKKPHVHILLMFDSVKSYTQIFEVTKELNGTIPQVCASVRGLVRYMAHLDDPEKYQYDKELIKTHGGIEIEKFFSSAMSKKCEKLKEITEFIIETGIIEFEDLYVYAMKNRSDDWYPLLCSSDATPIHMLLRSRRHRTRE